MAFQLQLDSQENKSWTDDLPVCPSTGIGLSTNQIYREDGHRREAHEFEDRSFHFKIDDNFLLFGVFDGHDGSNVADFAAQRMPAEILLGQLQATSSPAEVKQVLREAFLAVERSYFESIDDLLAERTNLVCELPEGIKSLEAYEQYPDIVSRLQLLNQRMSAGTSAAVALIFKRQLYVANVGDCRALLCKIDSDGVLRLMQLSVDHDLTNEDELLRLSHLGLDTEKLHQSSPGNSRLMTRCLGNYAVKGGYKDFDLFSSARGEPVISDPEITAGISLDESCRFLILMTSGLYQALEESIKSGQSNKEIAQLVVEQFAVQNTLTGVAQGVVDRIVRIHHDTFMQDVNHRSCRQREDITLLLHNFNYPFSTPSECGTLRSTLNSTISTQFQVGGVIRNDEVSLTETLTETSMTSSDSSEAAKGLAKISLDEDGRIAPYVDFSGYYQAVQMANSSTDTS